MTNEVINLKDVKNIKKAKLLIEKLDKAVHIMNLSIQSLSYFKTLTPVMEAMSSLQNNKTLLEVHNGKLKNFVKNNGKSI